MKSLDNHDPEMRPEYDFSGARRGHHAKAYAAGTNVVLLDPDIAARFSNSAQVNDALRQLISNSGARVKRKRDEIRRKRSDTLVKTLRKEYGDDFLRGFRADATLGKVLKKTGAASLSELLKSRNHSRATPP